MVYFDKKSDKTAYWEERYIKRLPQSQFYSLQKMLQKKVKLQCE